MHYSFIHQLEYQIDWSKKGANIIMHSADTKLVSRQLKSDFAVIRAGNGDGAMAEGAEVEGV